MFAVVPGTSLGIITDTSFSSLKESISEQTMKGIGEMGFTHMTEIQAKSIPHLLEGRFVASLSPSLTDFPPHISFKLSK